MEFLSVETDFSQSHFLISGMCFPILSCLRLLCLLVELEALPEALPPQPQTGLVQIIPINPGLSRQSSQACFPEAVSTMVCLLTLWGPLNTKRLLNICLPASVSLPLPQAILPTPPPIPPTLTPSASQGLSSLHLRNFVQRDACMLTTIHNSPHSLS